MSTKRIKPSAEFTAFLVQQPEYRDLCDRFTSAHPDHLCESTTRPVVSLSDFIDDLNKNKDGTYTFIRVLNAQDRESFVAILSTDPQLMTDVYHSKSIKLVDWSRIMGSLPNVHDYRVHRQAYYREIVGDLPIPKYDGTISMAAHAVVEYAFYIRQSIQPTEYTGFAKHVIDFVTNIKQPFSPNTSAYILIVNGRMKRFDIRTMSVSYYDGSSERRGQVYRVPPVVF